MSSTNRWMRYLDAISRNKNNYSVTSDNLRFKRPVFFRFFVLFFGEAFKRKKSKFDRPTRISFLHLPEHQGLSLLCFCKKKFCQIPITSSCLLSLPPTIISTASFGATHSSPLTFDDFLRRFWRRRLQTNTMWHGRVEYWRCNTVIRKTRISLT